jgi:hypothetical protein
MNSHAYGNRLLMFKNRCYVIQSYIPISSSGSKPAYGIKLSYSQKKLKDCPLSTCPE